MRGAPLRRFASFRRLCALGVLGAILFWAAPGWGQAGPRPPRLGYAYPAGGQAGSRVLVTLGGQFLRRGSEVYVSGSGVSARVMETYRPVRNIQAEQRFELQTRLSQLRERRLAQLPEAERALWPELGELRRPRPASTPETSTTFQPLQHPLLHQLDEMDLPELYHLASLIFFPRYKRQPNAQIEETALIEVRIAPDAAPGDRELRLATPQGLSNPILFQVGTLPETRELEPNDPGVNRPIPAPPPLDLPVLINGQIMPGDVDSFRFRARKGQKLVLEARARGLIPYLADAVPGWFQATLALYDAEGREVACADDYRFHPDPVLYYEVPRSGEYRVEIRDSIYRGREDFVYRLAIGELPFITEVFPLGGRQGQRTVAALAGWNLPATRVALDTGPGGPRVRRTGLRGGAAPSNLVSYAVDDLPECLEVEPNHDARRAQRIALPQIVNGRIGRPGDVDVFRFAGQAGQEVVVEVEARRLGSPLDSLLRLRNAEGEILAWNDDTPEAETGLLTHHADSYLRVTLPRDGDYDVDLSDAQRQGGGAFAYRLRVGAPRPDFALRVVPSSLFALPGRSVPVTVHALRKDGFAGEIELALRDGPAGFSLAPALIAAGSDRLEATLSAPRGPARPPVALLLVGRAQIAGTTWERAAVPAEEMMQAFSYRHLVPVQELRLVVGGRRP